MIQLIEKQPGKYTLKINGLVCVFMPMCLFCGRGERPNMADYDNQSLGYLDLAAWQAAENALIKGKLIIVEKL